MIKCQKCNFENEDNAVFCCNCGKKLEIQTKRDNKALAWLGLVTLVMGFLGIFYYIDTPSNRDKDDIYLQLEADQPLDNLINDYRYEGNINKNGDKINFTIRTNADWATRENFSIKIFRIAFYSYKHEQFYSQGSFSITEEREQHCIPPTCTTNFLDDRHFSITVDANKGTDRLIVFKIELTNEGEYIESCFIDYKQQGEWSREKEIVQEMEEETEERISTSSSYSTTHVPRQCTGCGGTGQCYNCNGTGYMMTVMGTTYCPICGSSGKCPFCYGSGSAIF